MRIEVRRESDYQLMGTMELPDGFNLHILRIPEIKDVGVHAHTMHMIKARFDGGRMRRALTTDMSIDLLRRMPSFIEAS